MTRPGLMMSPPAVGGSPLIWGRLPRFAMPRTRHALSHAGRGAHLTRLCEAAGPTTVGRARRAPGGPAFRSATHCRKKEVPHRRGEARAAGRLRAAQRLDQARTPLDARVGGRSWPEAAAAARARRGWDGDCVGLARLAPSRGRCRGCEHFYLAGKWTPCPPWPSRRCVSSSSPAAPPPAPTQRRARLRRGYFRAQPRARAPRLGALTAQCSARSGSLS